MFYAKKTNIEELKAFMMKNADPDRDLYYKEPAENKENSKDNVCNFDFVAGMIPLNTRDGIDYNGIFFDTENLSTPERPEFGVAEYKQIGDFAVAFCAGAGDWEEPVVFVLYLGADNLIHAYVPEKGNGFNPITRTAFGSEDDSYNEEEWLDYISKNSNNYEDFINNKYEDFVKNNTTYDIDMMIKDIEDNIVVK